MADSNHFDSGHDEYEAVHEDEVNEAGFPRQKTKSETLAELRRKEQGQKVPLTKVDYTSRLRKTEKVEASPRDRKTSEDSPKYLQQLRKAETGIDTQPMYVRLTKQGNEESEGNVSIPEKKFTAEELMDMAFKKADDADERDPALRRGIAQKPATSAGTFQGLHITNGEKEDYKAALKQHVQVEHKVAAKAQDSKPSWANIQPKRVLNMDMKTRSSKENGKDVPEWANRGAKKNVVGLGYQKPQEKSKAPDWANLVNKTDRRRLIELEHKKNPSAEAKQPEWASKAKDSRGVLRVENRKKQVTPDEQPDYRGALRKGARKDSASFCELQNSLQETPLQPTMGWRLKKRLYQDGDLSGNNSDDSSGEAADQVFDGSMLHNGGSKNQNGGSGNQNGGSRNQNGGSGNEYGKSVKNESGSSEENERKVRRKYSGFQEQRRRKSSASRFSLAFALPADLKQEVEEILMDWVQEIMTDYKDCNVCDFTTSWEDGIAFCNIMHFYESEKVPVHKVNSSAKRSNLMIAFQVASDSDIPVPISVDDFMKDKVPDHGKVFDILYEIYAHYHGAVVEWAALDKQ